jgi:hypothetical protein
MSRLGALVVLVVRLAFAEAAGAETPAGSVSGMVVDARTGRPLADVIVLHQASAKSVSTDRAGRFRLEDLPPGPCSIVFSIVGYGFARREVQVPPGQTLEVQVPLAEGAATYTEELTVTEDVFPSREGAATERVLGAAALQDLRGVMLDDPIRAVQVLPGVQAPDDFHSVFSARGIPFRNMGFVLDGVPSPFLLHSTREVEGGGSVTAVSGDVLDEVSLLAGSHPQKYGNRTGGQLEFHTREGSRDRRGVRLALSGSSASAVAEGPLGGGRRGSWLVSGRKSYTEILFRQIFDDDSFTFGFADAFAKLAYDPAPRHQLQLGLLAGRSRFDQRGDLGVNEARDSTQSLGLGYLGWRFTSDALVVQQRLYGVGARFANRGRDGAELDRGLDRQLGWRADATWTAAPWLTLRSGGHIAHALGAHTSRRHVPDDAPLVLLDDFDRGASSLGAYGQGRWSPVPALTITPGVRLDRWTLIGETAASPWMQAEWRVGDVRLRGAAGIHRQAPDFEHLLGQYGSAGLRPERARHLDAVFEHRPADTFRWQVAVFQRRERDGLRLAGSEARRVGSTLVFPSSEARWANTLEGHARGVEVLLERRGARRLGGWMSYAYLRHRLNDVATGESFWSDFDQRHTFNVYGHARLTSRTGLGLKFRASSNAPITGYWEERRPTGFEPPRAPLPGFDPPIGYFVGERRNELRLPAYARLDLRASHTRQWGRARATLFAEVVNAFNRDNRRVASPSVDGRTGRASDLTESLFPIVPSAGILVEF